MHGTTWEVERGHNITKGRDFDDDLNVKQNVENLNAFNLVLYYALKFRNVLIYTIKADISKFLLVCKIIMQFSDG